MHSLNFFVCVRFLANAIDPDVCQLVLRPSFKNWCRFDFLDLDGCAFLLFRNQVDPTKVVVSKGASVEAPLTKVSRSIALLAGGWFSREGGLWETTAVAASGMVF